MKAYMIVMQPDLEKLEDMVNLHIEHGYVPHGSFYHLEPDKYVTSGWVQAMYKKPTKTKTSRASKDTYPEWFETIWKNYPKRLGGNPKAKAFSAISARIKAGAKVPDIAEGVVRYATFCEVTDKVGTEYVKLASTFFGPYKHYEETWELPTKVERIQVPQEDSKLEAFAVDQGLHQPGRAPQHLRNTYEYRRWIEEAVK